MRPGPQTTPSSPRSVPQHEIPAGHGPGLTLGLGDMRAAEVNRQLDELIARFAADLERGALISVSDQGIRIRHLPAT